MILDHLRSGEKSVGELMDFLCLSEPKVSEHLAALRAQGVVTTRREGKTILYSLADPRIVQACDLCHDFLADRMRDNQTFAAYFHRDHPLRAIKPASNVIEIHGEMKDGFNN